MTRVLLMLIITIAAGQDATQTAGNPDSDVSYAVKGAQYLRFLMRDPDSFKLSLALITDDGNVCYQYQARNRLSGMAADTAVFPKSARQLADNKDTGFILMGGSGWERYCVKGTMFKWHLRDGKDVTDDVKKALRATED